MLNVCRDIKHMKLVFKCVFFLCKRYLQGPYLNSVCVVVARQICTDICIVIQQRLRKMDPGSGDKSTVKQSSVNSLIVMSKRCNDFSLGSWRWRWWNLDFRIFVPKFKVNAGNWCLIHLTAGVCPWKCGWRWEGRARWGWRWARCRSSWHRRCRAGRSWPGNHVITEEVQDFTWTKRATSTSIAVRLIAMIDS